MADKERMKPDQWLESVLYVSSSVSTLLVSWQEGHGPIIVCATYAQMFFFGASGVNKSRELPANAGSH